MHGDYQLAYCLITQTVSLAFCDRAFKNTALTPELIWHLQVPKHSQSLPLQWKADKLDLPLLQCVEQTLYSYEVHKSLPMAYDSSQQVLKGLDQDARFEDDLGHYNYWTANEANCMYLSIEPNSAEKTSNQFYYRPLTDQCLVLLPSG